METRRGTRVTHKAARARWKNGAAFQEKEKEKGKDSFSLSLSLSRVLAIPS